MNFKINSKKAVLVSIFLVALILVGSAFAEEDGGEPSRGIGGQFLDSFVCIFTQCGWPAIIIFLLPAVAVYIWKKFFSLF